MARLAQKYLCVPATAVPSERMWSVAGNVVSDWRTNLSPRSIEDLILLHGNVDMLFEQYREQMPPATLVRAENPGEETRYNGRKVRVKRALCPGKDAAPVGVAAGAAAGAGSGAV